MQVSSSTPGMALATKSNLVEDIIPDVLLCAIIFENCYKARGWHEPVECLPREMKQSHQPRSGLHPPDSPDVTHFGVNPFSIQPMVGIRRLMPTMGYRIKPLCGKNNEAPTESSEP